MKSHCCSAVEFIGRLFIAQLFLISGFNKIMAFTATQSYMEAHHMMGGLAWLVVAFELVTAILLIIGLWTRWVALLVALFCISAALLFHSNWADHMDKMMFMKDIALAGGLLILSAHGAKCWSMDACCCKKKEGSCGTSCCNSSGNACKTDADACKTSSNACKKNGTGCKTHTEEHKS